MGPLTYRKAGVDIEAGEETVRLIAPPAASTRRPGGEGGIGTFREVLIAVWERVFEAGEIKPEAWGVGYV